MSQEYQPSQEHYYADGATPRATNDHRQGYIQPHYPNSAHSYEGDGGFGEQQQPQSAYEHAPIVPPPRSFTMLQNRSVPHLPSEQVHASPEEPVPPLPPPYDPTSALDSFKALGINDPVQRAPSQASMHYDPIPRSGTSMSNRSYTRPMNGGLPSRNIRRPTGQILPPQAEVPYSDVMSIHSASSGDRQSGAYTDGGEYQPYAPSETDATSFYSMQSGPSDPAAHQQAYGYAPQQYGAPVHPGLPGPNEYNNLYAAASNVLGVGGPPPGPGGYAPPPPPNQGYGAHPTESVVSFSSSHSMPSMDTVGAMPYAQGPPSGYAPSMMSSNQSVLSPIEDAEFEPRPPMNRQGTAASVSLNTRKTKAVDLRAPPYTKEYIDGYRQRIKADPDPEAHFQYAKYLIDAAKKIGADAKDQRAVKKYRDTLVQESLKVMRRLATQGQPYDEAQFFLANCHGTGMLGLQVDHEKAYHLYLQAAKQNHPAATYRVAVCNEIGAGTRKEPPRAAAFYRKAASLGDTAAMYKLGMILLHGTLGEAKNPREAIGWLRRAAEQADEDNPHALHELALLHEMPNGQYVPYDPYRAKELLTRAAYLGYTQSQYKLAQCYEYGTLGCPVDPRRSIGWYTKAAEKGNAEAELALSGWYLTGSEGVLVQSDSEAYLWARRAANKGLSKAEYAVGYYAEVGIGIKQDIEFAKRWYMRAAAQGNKRAMARLTEMKRQGNKRTNVARPTRQQAKDECVIS